MLNIYMLQAIFKNITMDLVYNNLPAIMQAYWKCTINNCLISFKKVPCPEWHLSLV